MGFWGIEVKPGKPYKYHSTDVEGTVYVTQATLGRGKSTEKCVLQCSSRDKSPVYLCSLLPDEVECCPLCLEFEDADDVVFSVVGTRSIHIAGKFLADEEHSDEECYDSDSFGEDIADTDTDDSNDYGSEDEYEGDFIDDDDDTDLVPNSGVTIEEIVDDDKPATENGKSKQPKKKKKKKDHMSGSEEKDLQRQIVAKSSSGVPVLESEDEDGFPISLSHKNDVTVEKPVAETEQIEKRITEKTKKRKSQDTEEHATGVERKVEDVDQVLQTEREKKRKKKKHQKEEDEGKDEDQPEEVKHQNLNQVSSAGSDLDHKAMDVNETRSEGKNKKKNKKKKKKKKSETAGDLTSMEQTVSGIEDKSVQVVEPKSSQARTFGNGLVIEELSMGKPDGKRASPGKVVGVHYTGKLQSGEIFDSSIGGKPFTFRLGVGGVIKGWDIGVNGMRVGDKRRLRIPPSMGYGAEGAGEKIPPDSWLVFDIELVEVR